MVNSNSLECIIIRHADTNYNDYGDRNDSDWELTELGEKQCIELGNRLKDLKIDAYITSPMLRAFKTAAGVCNAKIDKPILQIMPEIIECGISAGYYGCSEEYLKKYYANTKMCQSLFDSEQYEFNTNYACDNALRAKKVIDYIKNEYSYGKRIVLFTHKEFSQFLISEALNLGEAPFYFAMKNVALTKIEFLSDGRILLHGFNS